MVTKRIVNTEVLESVRGTPCVICAKPSDPAHIKSRGSGGDDAPDNVLPLCRFHHQIQHAKGWSMFCSMYPAVGEALSKRGWGMVLEFGVWRLRRV